MIATRRDEVRLSGLGTESRGKGIDLGSYYRETIYIYKSKAMGEQRKLLQRKSDHGGMTKRPSDQVAKSREV